MAEARAREEVIVEIEADSELAKALAASGKKQVTIICDVPLPVAERDPDDLWADYDPEAVREALRAVAGIFTPEEGERLKRMVYPWRDDEGRRIDPPELDTALAFAAVQAVMGPLAAEEAGHIKALMQEGRALRSQHTDAS